MDNIRDFFSGTSIPFRGAPSEDRVPMLPPPPQPPQAAPLPPKLDTSRAREYQLDYAPPPQPPAAPQPPAPPPVSMRPEAVHAPGVHEYQMDAPAPDHAPPVAAAADKPPPTRLQRLYEWSKAEMRKIRKNEFVQFALVLFGVMGFILLFVHVGQTQHDVHEVRKYVREHINATLAIAHFFEVLHVVNDLHSKDVQCLTLLAECEDLSISGLDQGASAQLKRMCSNVVARCERMVKNHLEHLAELTFDAGQCVQIGEGDPFCYPGVEVSSADTLQGVRYDRVGPSSAMFGPGASPAEQSMLNRQEYGVFAAFSFFGAPGAGSARDGVAYVSLNATSPAFGRASVLLETPERGWVHNFYADHERVVALGLDSNKIYHWDVSASLALAVAGTPVTGADMATGTASVDGALSRPWSVRRLASGDYVVSMLDSDGTACTMTNAQLCGGLMKLAAASLTSSPSTAPSRFDNVADPLHATRHTPGDCALFAGGAAGMACGAFGSYNSVLSARCIDPATDIFGTPAWGAQINVYTATGALVEQKDLAPFALPDLVPAYAPRPVADWQAYGGYIPNRIVQLHNRADAFLAVDTFGGAILGFVSNGAAPSSLWNGASLAWVLPIGGNPADPGNATFYTSPMVTDAIVSPDNCMLYVASPTLGQVRAYSLCDARAEGLASPQLCATHQLTGGVLSTAPFVHASNPSRPLVGGPANLAITPDGEFLYASSSSVFDDCLFPDAIAAGGYMVRYKAAAARCDALSLDLDPGFFVDGNALPGRTGIPARIGTIAFASGDAKLAQTDRTLGF